MARVKREDQMKQGNVCFRTDAVELSPLVDLPNGFARGEARLTRTGVFVYRFADGSETRELRHPDDVFDPASLATAQMLPITDGHPPVDVTTENVEDLICGYTGSSVVVDGQRFLRSDVLLTNREVIDGVRGGRDEVSCGYYADVVEESGEYEGEPYDTRQRSIRYNHLAANIEAGRAGPEVRIRADRRDAVLVGPSITNKNRRTVDDDKEPSVSTRKIKINKIDMDVPEQTAQAIEAEIAEYKAKIVELEGKLAAAGGAVDAEGAKVVAAEAAQAEAMKQADALKAKADALEEQVKALKADRGDAKIAEAAKARVKLMRVADAVLDGEKRSKMDDMSDDEIRKAVILSVTPGAKLDDKSAEYVAARYDAVVDSMRDEPLEPRDVRDLREANADRADDDESHVDNDLARFDAEGARHKMRETARGSWRNEKQKPSA